LVQIPQGALLRTGKRLWNLNGNKSERG